MLYCKVQCVSRCACRFVMNQKCSENEKTIVGISIPFKCIQQLCRAQNYQMTIFV